MSDFVIETARLRLRGWREGDDAHVAAIETPTFMRWLHDDGMEPRRPGSTTARMQAMQAEHGFCFWVVEPRASDVFMGYCGLKWVDAEGTELRGAMEIGWGIGEGFQGQGYATEAAEAALAHAFTVHAAPFVVAFTVAGNRPSWRVMERVGMQRRQDLDYHDPAFSAALNPTIVYRIDRHHWEQRR